VLWFVFLKAKIARKAGNKWGGVRRSRNKQFGGKAARKKI
jgi:hypothetical protein